MNQIDLAKDSLNESQIRFEVAEHIYNKNGYAFCVRICQEAVELALKAALRLIGVDPPKWHDVGPFLKEKMESYPKWFQNKITELALISKLLASKREPAMYGDERTKKTPSSMFNKSDAKDALKSVEFCLKNVKELFRQI